MTYVGDIRNLVYLKEDSLTAKGTRVLKKHAGSIQRTVSISAR